MSSTSTIDIDHKIDLDHSAYDLEKPKPNFNKDATPFIPQMSNSFNLQSNDNIEGSMRPDITKNSFQIVISNLPNIDQLEVIQLINKNLPGVLVNIIDFANNNLNYNNQPDLNCLVELYDYQLAMDLMMTLNGLELHNHCLKVDLLPTYHPQFFPFYQQYPPMTSFGTYFPWQGYQYPKIVYTPMSVPSELANSGPSDPSSSPRFPPFLMGLMANNDSSTSDTIIIKNDQGSAIKVNPRKVFIGNVPFTSTWKTLKEFLITKSKEFEPDNNINILDVEIPINPNTNYRTSQDHLITNLVNKESGHVTTNSRGFAIITTGDKSSSDKLIKYFDGIEFEGRALTVRFDRFPEFNNRVFQQHPNSEKTLTHLALERNSFHLKFYYENQQYMDPSYQNYPNLCGRRRNSFPKFPIVQPNFVPPIHPSVRYTMNLNVPRLAKKKLDDEPNDSRNEDDKARDLVNSFKSLGIS